MQDGTGLPLEHPGDRARLGVDWVTRHADGAPPGPERRDVIAERLTRPLSLHAGALRNAADALTQAAGALARGPR